MIEAKGLTKYYGDKPGVIDITFKIDKGETVGLLGPNGAGKTTIMKMLAGHMLPSAGAILIDGIDSLENPKEAFYHIGFMPEVPPLYVDMDVQSFLSFVSEIRGVDARRRSNHIKEVMDLTAISHVKGRLIKNLSKGYRQRVGLAQALVGFPDVLIFDEPTVGLDPKQITEVRKLIEELSRDHTVILSSHILPEVTMICKRIMIINNGRMVLEDTVENLEEGGGSFSIRVKGDQMKVVELLCSVQGVKNVQPTGDDMEKNGEYQRYVVTGRVDTKVREEIFRRFAAADLPIVELRTVGNTLEDVFLEITAK